MKRIILSTILIIRTILCFAAKIPAWIDNPESVYPREKYIARTGSGFTIENAKANAMAQIAEYFGSQVVVSTEAASSMRNNGKETQKEQELNQNVKIFSEKNLSAVEYSESFYNKKKKTYYIAAYIERTTFWQYVENDLLEAENKYKSMLNFAKKTNNPVLRYKYLKKAKQSGNEYIQLLSEGFLVLPEKKKEFRTIISDISSNEELESLYSTHVTFKIQTEGDYENFISSKVIEAFKQNGFIPVANNAQSLLRIVINSNQKTADEITSIFPEISIILSDNKKDEIYFTYQNSWGKTSSFSLPQAQKKAFPTIAEELKKELAVKIEEAF